MIKPRFFVLLLVLCFSISCSSRGNQHAFDMCNDFTAFDETAMKLIEGKTLLNFSEIGDSHYTKKAFGHLLDSKDRKYYWCDFGSANGKGDYDSTELLIERTVNSQENGAMADSRLFLTLHITRDRGVRKLIDETIYEPE